MITRSRARALAAAEATAGAQTLDPPEETEEVLFSESDLFDDFEDGVHTSRNQPQTLSLVQGVEVSQVGHHVQRMLERAVDNARSQIDRVIRDQEDKHELALERMETRWQNAVDLAHLDTQEHTAALMSSAREQTLEAAQAQAAEQMEVVISAVTEHTHSLQLGFESRLESLHANLATHLAQTQERLNEEIITATAQTETALRSSLEERTNALGAAVLKLGDDINSIFGRLEDTDERIKVVATDQAQGHARTQQLLIPLAQEHTRYKEETESRLQQLSASIAECSRGMSKAVNDGILQEVQARTDARIDGIVNEVEQKLESSIRTMQQQVQTSLSLSAETNQRLNHDMTSFALKSDNALRKRLELRTEALGVDMRTLNCQIETIGTQLRDLDTRVKFKATEDAKGCTDVNELLRPLIEDHNKHKELTHRRLQEMTKSLKIYSRGIDESVKEGILHEAQERVEGRVSCMINDSQRRIEESFKSSLQLCMDRISEETRSVNSGTQGQVDQHLAQIKNTGIELERSIDSRVQAAVDKAVAAAIKFMPGASQPKGISNDKTDAQLLDLAARVKAVEEGQHRLEQRQATMSAADEQIETKLQKRYDTARKSDQNKFALSIMKLEKRITAIETQDQSPEEAGNAPDSIEQRLQMLFKKAKLETEACHNSSIKALDCRVEQLSRTVARMELAAKRTNVSTCHESLVDGSETIVVDLTASSSSSEEGMNPPPSKLDDSMAAKLKKVELDVNAAHQKLDLIFLELGKTISSQRIQTEKHRHAVLDLTLAVAKANSEANVIREELHKVDSAAIIGKKQANTAVDGISLRLEDLGQNASSLQEKMLAISTTLDRLDAVNNAGLLGHTSEGEINSITKPSLDETNKVEARHTVKCGAAHCDKKSLSSRKVSFKPHVSLSSARRLAQTEVQNRATKRADEFSKGGSRRGRS